MTTTIQRFVTDTGVEVPAVDADQMREVDRIAIEERGPNLFQMMENAGSNLALTALEMLGDGWRRRKIVALAGTGGNGGGTICAARHLANRGVDVRLCLTRSDHLAEVSAYQRHVFASTSGREVTIGRLDIEPVELILDGLIGYSLQGPAHGAALELIQWANGSGAPILSLDVPSGVDATSGEAGGEFAHADRTMTLALPKTGLDPKKTGELLLADLGIPAAVYHQLGLAYTNPFDRRRRVPLAVP